MKKILLLALTLMLLTVSFSQRGGRGGGHFGGGFGGGYSRSMTYVSQPRISVQSVPMRQSVMVAPRVAIHQGYLPYVHRGVNFYYRGGFFYDPYFNWFYPTIGFALGILPTGYYSFMYDGFPYYYYGGVYYTQNVNTKEYEVVSPVVGAIVPELPKEVKTIYIDNKKCYVTKDNVYYEEFMDGNTLKYKVIGKEE